MDPTLGDCSADAPPNNFLGDRAQAAALTTRPSIFSSPFPFPIAYGCFFSTFSDLDFQPSDDLMIAMKVGKHTVKMIRGRGPRSPAWRTGCGCDLPRRWRWVSPDRPAPSPRACAPGNPSRCCTCSSPWLTNTNRSDYQITIQWGKIISDFNSAMQGINFYLGCGEPLIGFWPYFLQV